MGVPGNSHMARHVVNYPNGLFGRAAGLNIDDDQGWVPIDQTSQRDSRIRHETSSLFTINYLSSAKQQRQIT